MPAPWSEYEEIVKHTLSLIDEATRSDFLNISHANDVSDDVIDGFDSLREGVMFSSLDEAKAALEAAGAIAA